MRRRSASTLLAVLLIISAFVHLSGFGLIELVHYLVEVELHHHGGEPHQIPHHVVGVSKRPVHNCHNCLASHSRIHVGLWQPSAGRPAIEPRLSRFVGIRIGHSAPARRHLKPRSPPV